MGGGDFTIKNKIILPVVAFAVITASLFTAANVFAQDANSYPPIVQKLAQRFNLNEDDVKAVFDEAKQEKKAKMQSSFEDFLNQAIKDGKITENQKQKILEKRKELQTDRLNKKGDLQKWAQENNINLEYLFGGRRGHFKSRGGMDEIG